MTDYFSTPESFAGSFWHQSSSIDSTLPLLATESVDPATFALLADNIPTLCWIARGDGYIVWYNRRWHEYCGTTPEAMEGWGWQSVHDPVELPKVLERWSQSIELGKPFEMVFPLRGADGVFRPFLTRISPLRDASGNVARWFGVNMEIGAQVRAEHAAKTAADLNEVLTHELSHRIKNIFAIVSSLIRLSIRREPGAGQFGRDLLDRIRALGRAHEFARPHSEESQPQLSEGMLRGLLQEILRPYRQGEIQIIDIAGVDVAVDDKAATPLALLFHELATNAVKYGSLSDPDGRVAIQVGFADEDRVVIVWRESGGPRLSGPPEREGFGSRLAMISVQQQLGGKITHQWLADGLCVEVHVDRTHLVRNNGI